MIRYILLSVRACFLLAFHLFLSIPAEGWRHCWKRIPLFILLWFSFVVLTLQHIIGFLLDEVLFHGYRHIRIDKAVFILGIPRSGTTYLQRVLANDSLFATLSTWETIFAPSVTERYCYRFAGSLLKPLGFLLGRFGKRIFRQMDNIHIIGLQEPEEDFLLLGWIQFCFLPVLFCPGIGHYWKLADFDRAFSGREKKAVLDYYRLCLQKHLFYHGRDKMILSKNPSFTPFLESLAETFPDARFIACVRRPDEVIPSQLSALRPIMSLAGAGKLQPSVQEKLIGCLHGYYGILNKRADDDRLAILPMAVLQEHLLATVSSLYAFLGLELSERFRQNLEEQSRNSGSYRSSHRYLAEEFSLSSASITTLFQDVWPVRQTLYPEVI